MTFQEFESLEHVESAVKADCFTEAGTPSRRCLAPSAIF